MAACRRLGIGRTVRMAAISMSLVMLVTRYIDRQPKRILSGQLVRCRDGDADGAAQRDCKRLRGGFFQLEYDDDYKEGMSLTYAPGLGEYLPGMEPTASPTSPPILSAMATNTELNSPLALDPNNANNRPFDGTELLVPPGHIVVDMCEKRLFIGGLPRNFQNQDLVHFFSRFGEITDSNVNTNPQTGLSRGFGFVNFKETQSMERCIAAKPHYIWGKWIDVKRARPLVQAHGNKAIRELGARPSQTPWGRPRPDLETMDPHYLPPPPPQTHQDKAGTPLSQSQAYEPSPSTRSPYRDVTQTPPASISMPTLASPRSPIPNLSPQLQPQQPLIPPPGFQAAHGYRGFPGGIPAQMGSGAGPGYGGGYYGQYYSG
ncbi:hypothetical protein AAMO2058_000148100 [Amorphochlora amoebiformis]